MIIIDPICSVIRTVLNIWWWLRLSNYQWL